MLGLKRGICSPARSSAVLTGERRPHAAPEPQQAAGGNLCKPPTHSHAQEPTWGFLIPRLLLCPLSPNNGMCGSVQERSYVDF